ncbi:hypothetical protein CEXT_3511, partial [Caerostris extrusa]
GFLNCGTRCIDILGCKSSGVHVELLTSLDQEKEQQRGVIPEVHKRGTVDRGGLIDTGVGLIASTSSQGDELSIISDSVDVLKFLKKTALNDAMFVT